MPKGVRPTSGSSSNTLQAGSLSPDQLGSEARRKEHLISQLSVTKLLSPSALADSKGQPLHHALEFLGCCLSTDCETGGPGWSLRACIPTQAHADASAAVVQGPH